MQRIHSFRDADGNDYDVPESDLENFASTGIQANELEHWTDDEGNSYDVPSNEREAFLQAIPTAQKTYRISAEGADPIDIRESDSGRFLLHYRNSDEYKADREATDRKAREAVGKNESVIGGALKGFGTGAVEGGKAVAEGLTGGIVEDVPSMAMSTTAFALRNPWLMGPVGGIAQLANGGVAPKPMRDLADKVSGVRSRYKGFWEVADWNQNDTGLSGVDVAHSVGRSLGPQLLTMGATGAASALGMAPKLAQLLGSVANVAGFAAERGEDVYQTAKENGASDADALKLSNLAATVEGGLEGVSELVGMGFARRAAQATTAAVGKQVLKSKPAQQLIKEFGKSLAGEIPTEMMQEGFGNVIDQYAAGKRFRDGSLDTKQSWDAATAAILPTILQVGAMGGGGAIGNAQVRKMNNRAQAESIFADDSLTEAWIASHPQAAMELAEIDKPSRSDFVKAGLPSMPGDERTAVAESIKANMKGGFKILGTDHCAAIRKGIMDSVMKNPNATEDMAVAFADKVLGPATEEETEVLLSLYQQAEGDPVSYEMNGREYQPSDLIAPGEYKTDKGTLTIKQPIFADRLYNSSQEDLTKKGFVDFVPYGAEGQTAQAPTPTATTPQETAPGSPAPTPAPTKPSGPPVTTAEIEAQKLRNKAKDMAHKDPRWRDAKTKQAQQNLIQEYAEKLNPKAEVDTGSIEPGKAEPTSYPHQKQAVDEDAIVPTKPYTPSKATFEVSTPNRETKVSGTYEVVDADSLVTSDNPNYDKALQPRNRDTASSKSQIEKIGREPDPELLLEAPDTAGGAPIVYGDTVISGNGRVMGLRRGQEYGSLGAYEKRIREYAQEHGITIPEGVKHPVLVRRMADGMKHGDLVKVAEYSNRSGVLQRTEAEEIRRAGEAIANNNLIDLYKETSDGNVMSAGNRDFVDSFIEKFGDESLRNSRGEATAIAAKRIREGLLYNVVSTSKEADEIVRILTEDADMYGLHTIRDGVAQAAPSIVKAATSNPKYDIRPAMAEAIAEYVAYKKSGKFASAEDYLQQDALWRETKISPFAQEAIRILDQHSRSAKRLAEIFNEYSRIAETVSRSSGEDALFSMGNDRTPAEVLKMAEEVIQKMHQKPSVSEEIQGRPVDASSTFTPSEDVVNAVKGFSNFLGRSTESVTFVDSSEELMAEGSRYEIREDEAKEPTQMDFWGHPEQMDLFMDQTGIPKSKKADFQNRIEKASEWADEARYLAAQLFTGKMFSTRQAERLFELPEANKGEYPTVSNILKQYFQGRADFDMTAIKGMKLASTEDAASLFLAMRNPYVESMKIVYLNGKDEILDARVLSIGGVDHAYSGKNTWTEDLPKGTKSVIISHNHPSGNPTPSQADYNVTDVARQDFRSKGVKVKEHIVTNGSRYFSFSKQEIIEIDDPVKNKWEITMDSHGRKQLSSPEAVVDVASLCRQGTDATIVFYLDTKNQIDSVRLVPSSEKDLLYAITSGIKDIAGHSIIVSKFGGKFQDFTSNNREADTIEEVKRLKAELAVLTNKATMDQGGSNNDFYRLLDFVVQFEDGTIKSPGDSSYLSIRRLGNNLPPNMNPFANPHNLINYSEKLEAYKNPDGGWITGFMKAPNGAKTNLPQREWVLVHSPEFKKWFGDWENDPDHASKILDENGEPKVLYHQTKTFLDYFSPYEKGAGKFDFARPAGIPLKGTDRDIRLDGKYQMPVFARVKNPRTFADRAEIVDFARTNIPAYAKSYDAFQEANAKWQEEYRKADKKAQAEYQQILADLDSGNLPVEKAGKKTAALKERIKKLENKWNSTKIRYADEMQRHLTSHLTKWEYDGVIIRDDETAGLDPVKDTVIPFSGNYIKSVDNVGSFGFATEQTVYMRDANTGKVMGSYNPKNGEVKLLKTADIESVMHELGWHATYHWAKKNSPETFQKMRQYAENAPQNVRQVVRELYGELDPEAFLDEVGAKLMTDENSAFARKILATQRSRSWWSKVKVFFGRLFHKWVRSNIDTVSASRYAWKSPSKMMRLIVKDALSGKRFEPSNKPSEMKFTPEQVEEASEAIRKARESGKERWWADLPFIQEAQTDLDAAGEETNKIISAERFAMRAEIARKVYSKASENAEKGRELHIVMGLPASGKSRIVVRRIQEKIKAITVDADDVKPLLPEYDNGIGAGRVHKESAVIAETYIMEQLARQNGDNIIFPTIGRNLVKLENIIRRFKEAGYKMFLYNVQVDPNTSIERALKRYVETGRFVSPEYIFNLGLQPQQTFDKLKLSKEVDSYAEWNNEVPKGAVPAFVEGNSRLLAEGSSNQRLQRGAHVGLDRSNQGGGEASWTRAITGRDDRVSESDLRGLRGSDQQGRPKKGTSLRARGDVEATGTDTNRSPVNKDMLVQKFRELFPELEIRGRATFKQPGLAGWYDKRTKVVRAYPRGIATYGHEIAHGISNLLDRSGKRPISETLPLTVGQEFQTVGRELYPDAKDAPAHFFMEEGFAEFVTGYICGKDVGATAPKALEWLNGEFADKNPDYRTRIEKMKLAISDYRNQAPEKAVRAFWSHEEPAIASGLRWTKRALGNAKGRWVDDAYWMLDDMRKAGIDVDLTSKNLSKEERTQAILHHPYILATMTKKSSGARTAFMALTETTDLLGSKVTGEGLSDVLAPVKNDLDRFLDYGVARVAQIYHERGMESGLSPAEVDATVRKYQSDLFDKTLDDVTSWSRRILHLMVEGGALTQEEFNKIEKDNAVYLPFMRKFLEGEISASAERAGKKGNGLLRRKGGVQSIQDPIAAMLMNAQSQIQKAQQSAVLKAIVQTYDDAMRSNRTDTNIAEWMVEVPAQQVKVDNRAEELKAEYIRMMEEKAGMTREQAEKEFNRNRTLNTLLSPWRTAQEYIGKDKIVSVVIDGKRRWFEVKDQRMMDFINGMGEKLDDNAIMQFSRKLTNSIRWGATMLNARFGLLRNPLRDTQTTALFADYHTHIPVISTLAGIIKHLEGGELSEQYERAGVGIDTTSAATLGQAQNLRGQVVARNKAERAFRAGVFKTVADVLGVTEIGPRIMEFQGAYNYWYKRTGSHEAATMMATAAAADVTVNFRRSGSFSSTASQLVLFLNAGIQSIDKFGRATGVLKALPWEKNQKRIARLGKVAGRALLTQTLVNMASYLLLKDDDDWQNLPAHEKYGYFHIRMWNGQLMRIPLPFEPGLLFGSLPVAICEQISGQNDNAVKEWAGVATGNLPIQVGGVKELASNLTPITPLVEILANEDWKGAQIVPTHVKDSREEKDWINTRTHEASKRLGAAIYKVVKDTKFAGAASPAYLEHVVDGYTGGMARGLLECVDMANDPSGIGANSDWSTIPVLGTLFVPRGMDRRTSDFYDERRRLERRANADDATPEEKGRYEAYRIFGQNALSPLLKRKRELMTDKELTAGERKQRIDETTAAVIERLADFYQDRAK